MDLANPRSRRFVQLDLPEEVVAGLIDVLVTSGTPVGARALPALRRALQAAQEPRSAGVPKRLAVFHAFSELSTDAQIVVAELTLWLHQENPRSRKQLKASLDALARQRRGIS